MIVSTLVFVLVRAAPGSPENSILKGTVATPETRQAVRDRFQLDEPVTSQYTSLLVDLLTLDFGESYQTREHIMDAIGERWSVTGPLIGIALAITLVIGFPLGVLAAYREGSPLDRAVSGLSIFGASVPPFAVAIVLLYVFTVWLGWFPATGQWSGPLEALTHLALPSVALALTGLAPLIKLTRTSVAETLGADHVAFARARGLSEGQVFIHHVFRNAAITVTTITGIIIVYMFSAVALVEVPFNLDGLGAYFVRAVETQDFPVIQALAFLTTIAILVVNLIVDLSYFLLDPRLRLRAAQ